ncbi:MAG: nucleotide 5'-monophosphate nucleosidase PpnN [Pseudohongiellaceae bacterium]|nr:nucleotide 5'-monophosphate nucleosidase PpnN [Pseudohongiellaceae bacterium]
MMQTDVSKTQEGPCFETCNASVSPRGTMELLSHEEVERLNGPRDSELSELFRRCALAVLNCDDSIDEASVIFNRYADFRVSILQRPRGVKLLLENAPACAFVDGRILDGVRDHLFAVLRDIVFVSGEYYELAMQREQKGELEDELFVSNLVFNILRNAGLLEPRKLPKLVVCWGGHSINRDEYQYCKDVGYQLGLRAHDICTGCGPGAMKGPMKGATIGHAKQRNTRGRYIGLTEPAIIAAESPNPIVNSLVIMPDIEKRLEAFVRLGHGIIVFPGGVGTLEEILFLLGTLMDEANADVCLPVIFTASANSRGYFDAVDAFLVSALGEQVRNYYSIIIDDPVQVARAMRDGMLKVGVNRRNSKDAYYFNWLLKVPAQLKQRFDVNHESMKRLNLSKSQPVAELVVDLRRAFSGIVAGNVKEPAMALIKEQGPFQLHGDPELLSAMDKLLRSFITEGRMKLGNKPYNPCYEIAS